MDTLTPSMRYEVLRRDGFACHYCGARSPAVELHVDHVMPVSLGGLTVPENLLTACQPCNSGKGNTPPDPALRERNTER